MKIGLIYLSVTIAVVIGILEYDSYKIHKRMAQRAAEQNSANEEYVRCAANAIANGVMNYEVICSK